MGASKAAAAVFLPLVALLLGGCEYPGVPHPLAAAAQQEGVAASAPTAGDVGENPAFPELVEGTPPARPSTGLGNDPFSGRARTTEPSTALDGQAPPVLQGKAAIVQRDFKLEPERLTVKAGAVTFVLKNEGRYTHDFRVEGQGVDAKAPKVGSGRTLEWRITLKPGTYRISCPVSNHADRGMVGTLTVVA